MAKLAEEGHRQKRQAPNFKIQAQSSDADNVLGCWRAGLMMCLLLLFIYTMILNFDHCPCPVCNQGVVMNVVNDIFLQSLNPWHRIKHKTTCKSQRITVCLAMVISKGWNLQTQYLTCPSLEGKFTFGPINAWQERKNDLALVGF